MITLYCDGSCPKPQGPGGWAYIITNGTREFSSSGGAMVTTNNRMEMLACMKGLRWLVKEMYGGNRVKIVSDSQYLIKGLSLYCFKWAKNDWCHTPYQSRKLVPIKNADLWKEAFELAHNSGLSTEFQWVRGHNGHEFNERCDVLAGIESRVRIGRLRNP